MKISVVDYGAGNLKSVISAIEYIGADYFVSSDPDRLRIGDKLIFPGVGHAKSAMQRLKAAGMDEMIKEYDAGGRPLLGICLGSQIMLDHSEEGDTQCLGLISGNSIRFKDSGKKIPHMGWNQVTPELSHPLFRGIPAGSSFYFVHSYYTIPLNSGNVLCTTDYEEVFASGIYRDNTASVQFHPEKSGKWGLKLLENFIQG